MKNLDLLVPKPYVPNDTFRWATVASNDPIRIRLDGEDDPLDITPDSLVKVRTFDRVWCQMHGRRVIILGVAGGEFADTTPWVRPTLQNGWESIAFTMPVRYRKLNGIVHLQGACNNGDPDVPIFTLPSGFRPELNLIYYGFVKTGQLEVNDDGVTKIFFSTDTAVSFNGISFPLDQ